MISYTDIIITGFALSVLPLIIMLTTSFMRIVIVFSILRQAIGLHQTPSNQIITALALILSFNIMNDEIATAYNVGLNAYTEEDQNYKEALMQASKPFKNFMLEQTRTASLNLFYNMARIDQNNADKEAPITILIPAFITSELTTAFQIGFMIYLPFLIIDLVISSSLMSMGMVMLSPTIISLPFKLLLFVMVDGWNLLMGSIALSFS